MTLSHQFPISLANKALFSALALYGMAGLLAVITSPDLATAQAKMEAARKELDDFEARLPGPYSTLEYKKLERKFNKAAVLYLKVANEPRK